MPPVVDGTKQVVTAAEAEIVSLGHPYAEGFPPALAPAECPAFAPECQALVSWARLP
jgi:hypothetical protein